MMLNVGTVEIARFGATTAVLHAFISRIDNRDGIPTPALMDEASVCLGIYGEMFNKALRRLENAGYISIDDEGLIYNMIAITED